MPEQDVIAMLTQFGTAGLVAWLWLSERRASAAREQQLSEAHARVMAQERELSVLVTALESNTRAMTAVEIGQRDLRGALERLGARGEKAGAGERAKARGRAGGGAAA